MEIFWLRTSPLEDSDNLPDRRFWRGQMAIRRELTKSIDRISARLDATLHGSRAFQDNTESEIG